jgi:hypothetical protein
MIYETRVFLLAAFAFAVLTTADKTAGGTILQRAQEQGTTLYKAVAALWDDDLIQKLRHPTIKAVWGA